MSQYDKLDSLIVDSIKGGCHSFYAIFNSRSVFDEAMRISMAIKLVQSIVVDRRLQALRRRGVIVHVTGWGWRMKEVA